MIAVLFLPLFLFYFKNYYLKNKRIVLIGLLSFGLILVPHLITIISGAFAARFNQVGSSGLEFGKHFLSYLSPRNLFSDIGSDLGRIAPGLGVFYSFLFIPFLMGLYLFVKFVEKKFIKLLFLCSIIFLIPVSLTGDVFYPLRALEFFWIVSIIIAIGLANINWKPVVLFSFYFLFSFYVSYFVLFKHETIENVGESYIKVISEFEKYPGYKIVIDSARDPAIGLRIAYLTSFDPSKMQSVLRPQLKTSYYSSDVSLDEVYRVDNIETRPINWGPDRCLKNAILVGDNLAFSDEQIRDHNLEKVFEIPSANKDFTLRGFSTHPDKQCL